MSWQVMKVSQEILIQEASDMDIIRIILVLVGLALLALAGVKKDFTQFSPGWLGLFVLGCVLLLNIVVKQ